MNPNWAEENLQTNRTLMERSAVYRHALAPIMLLAGGLGVIATIIGLGCHLNSARAFSLLWLVTALVTLAGALLVTRRQALKDQEIFWSPPTRRVTQALLPPLLAGMGLGLLPVFTGNSNEASQASAMIWILFYGCALHAAGFFMPRGIKLFGWIFIASGCVLFWVWIRGWADFHFSAHWLMGVFFGGLHLAYGAYLRVTEKGKNAA